MQRWPRLWPDVGGEPTREILACNLGAISPKADAMFARLRQTLTRLLVTVLLITISMHAAVPATAFEHARGSAFSATTTDVAVLASFRQTERPAGVQPEPVGPPTDSALYVSLPRHPGSTAIFRPLLWSHAPPLPSIRARPAQPRAPPAF